MMMNSFHNFDVGNPREYPDYADMTVSKENLPPRQRMMKSFNGKVLWSVILAIIFTLDLFFQKPLLISSRNHLTEIMLLFVAGLVPGICLTIVFRKRNKAPAAPLWRRIVVIIIFLIAIILVVYFLADNPYIRSLMLGAGVGSVAWDGIATFRSNWTSYG